MVARQGVLPTSHSHRHSDRVVVYARVSTFRSKPGLFFSPTSRRAERQVRVDAPIVAPSDQGRANRCLKQRLRVPPPPPIVSSAIVARGREKLHVRLWGSQMAEKIVPHMPSGNPCSTSRGLYYISCEFWFADRFISSDKRCAIPVMLSCDVSKFCSSLTAHIGVCL